MADWNNPRPPQVCFRYERDGNVYLMSGRLDESGQPLLPGLGHRMNLYGVVYVVESIEWGFDERAEPLWDRPVITVSLKNLY